MFFWLVICSTLLESKGQLYTAENSVFVALAVEGGSGLVVPGHHRAQDGSHVLPHRSRHNSMGFISPERAFGPHTVPSPRAGEGSRRAGTVGRRGRASPPGRGSSGRSRTHSCPPRPNRAQSWGMESLSLGPSGGQSQISIHKSGEWECRRLV